MKIRAGVICLLTGILLASVAVSTAAFPLVAQVHRWEDLSPEDRNRALRNYERFRQLPLAEQQEIQKRYRRWRGLPQGEQQRLRRLHRRYRALPPDVRSELRARPPVPKGQDE